jgi:manganese/zinc/iron transport system permease protein
VVRHGDRSVSLTQSGSAEAARLVHEHRLWELYLITHAEIAPSRVDRDADTIEHVLDAAMIQQLEDLLEQRQAVLGVVQSPHPVTDTSADGSTDPRDGMISSRNAGRSEIRREGL